MHVHVYEVVYLKHLIIFYFSSYTYLLKRVHFNSIYDDHGKSHILKASSK